MFKQERHDSILSILKEKRTATIEELAGRLFVSQSTVRRDLQVLEDFGFVKHYYGGAVLVDDASKALPIEMRRQEMQQSKMLIGQRALSLVQDGDVLFIDASSTCLCMVDGLRNFENLTVVTNGMCVMEALKEMNINTYCIGGRLLRNSMAFTGRFAEAIMREVHFTKSFFSMSGISEAGILSDGGEQENIIHCMLQNQTGLKVCLCDGSKLGASFMFRICSITDIDYIVSDVDVYGVIKKPSGPSAKLLLAKSAPTA